MDNTNEQFLQKIKEDFVAKVDRKYRAGYIEHFTENGNIWDVPNLVDFALEEVYDLFTYLMALKLQPLLKTATLPTKTPDEFEIKTKHHVPDHQGILHPQKGGDVGFDLVVSEDFEVPPLGQAFPVNVPCGFGVKLPEGYWAEIRPRSSTATKFGVLVYQSVMDTGYTGPWFVVCHSVIGKSVKVARGTRLAQCILHRSAVPGLVEVKELPQTERGDTGFGSSGLKV